MANVVRCAGLPSRPKPLRYFSDSIIRCVLLSSQKFYRYFTYTCGKKKKKSDILPAPGVSETPEVRTNEAPLATPF